MEYFFKLQLKTEGAARSAAARLGVDFEHPIRFAVCSAWVAAEAGFKLSASFKDSSVMTNVAAALEHAEFIGNKRIGVEDIIDDAEKSMELFRLGHKGYKGHIGQRTHKTEAQNRRARRQKNKNDTKDTKVKGHTR